MEKCPYCGAVQEKPLFGKSDEDGAVVQVECESCNRPIKVTLRIVESYAVALPDDIQKKLTTVGQRVRKNPRWNWCICYADRGQKLGCQCKSGTFEVMESYRSPNASSGFMVKARGDSGLLVAYDSNCFLPVEEKARPVGNLPTGR